MLRDAWPRWQQHRPRLHRDGVSLPASLLLKGLQRCLDSTQLSVDELLLDEYGAVLWLTLHHPWHTTLQLHCQATLDQTDGSLQLQYRLQGDPEQRGLRGKALGKLASLASEHQAGSLLLQNLCATLPWLTVLPQHLVIHWRVLPGLQDWLQRKPLARLAAGQLYIARLSTSQDTLRLHLARRPHRG